MIQFRGSLYKLEYDLMYFSGNMWLDRKTMTNGFILDSKSWTVGKIYQSELILNILR